MKSLRTRVAKLLDSSAGRIAEAERTGDFSKLTDDELRDYIRGGGATATRLAAATDADLEAIARGDVAGVQNDELRAWIEREAHNESA